MRRGAGIAIGTSSDSDQTKTMVHMARQKRLGTPPAKAVLNLALRIDLCARAFARLPSKGTGMAQGVTPLNLVQEHACHLLPNICRCDLGFLEPQQLRATHTALRAQVPPRCCLRHQEDAIAGSPSRVTLWHDLTSRPGGNGALHTARRPSPYEHTRAISYTTRGRLSPTESTGSVRDRSSCGGRARVRTGFGFTETTSVKIWTSASSFRRIPLADEKAALAFCGPMFMVHATPRILLTRPSSVRRIGCSIERRESTVTWTAALPSGGTARWRVDTVAVTPHALSRGSVAARNESMLSSRGALVYPLSVTSSDCIALHHTVIPHHDCIASYREIYTTNQAEIRPRCKRKTRPVNAACPGGCDNVPAC